MLGEAKVDEQGNVSDTKDSNVMYLDKDSEDREINVSSSLCYFYLVNCNIWLQAFHFIDAMIPVFHVSCDNPESFLSRTSNFLLSPVGRET